MRVIRSQMIVAVIALSVACGGDSTTPATGPLKLGIVSGNNQSARASDKKLTDPVVGKLVRAPNGTVSFRWLDALLPSKAFAQSGTVVTGSPVPGAVVCAVAVDTVHPLTPFVPCTNTDSNGQATFFFTTGTRAGTASAEIRGTLGNQPAVFDTATAVVLADTLVANVGVRNPTGGGQIDLGSFSVGDTITIDSLLTDVSDQYHNPIINWQSRWAFGTDSARICCLPPQPAPALFTKSRKAVVSAGARVLYLHFNDDTTLLAWFKLRTR